MKEAFLHDYVALADRKTYGLTGLKDPVQLDYNAALKALQRVDYNNPWNSLSSISRNEPGTVSQMAGSLNLAPQSSSMFSRIATRMNIGDGVPHFLALDIDGVQSAVSS